MCGVRDKRRALVRRGEKDFRPPRWFAPPAPHAKKFQWRARPLQPVETRGSGGTAGATAVSELLGLLPTIRSLRKHT